MAKKQKTLIKRWRSKYRLVVLNDETFEEKISLKLSRLNVFLVFTIAAILLIGSTLLLVAFTPLREYIPGYASTELRRAAVQLTLKTDSLETQLAYNKRYIENIKNIINGTPQNPIDTAQAVLEVAPTLDPEISAADSNLRNTVEGEERFNINSAVNRNIAGINFMAPIKGVITSHFEKSASHFGIDVTTRKNTPIKSCLNGTVVFSQWTTENGYVAIVQHSDELLSVYKHCSALLKNQGDVVQTGQAIAIIGNSGENSTGPHLHFELWYQGTPVNPENYISF